MEGGGCQNEADALVCCLLAHCIDLDWLLVSVWDHSELLIAGESSERLTAGKSSEQLTAGWLVRTVSSRWLVRAVSS